MSYTHGTMWFAAEKTARAQELGWPDYDTAIFEMYETEGLSFRIVGNWFCQTSQAIRERLANRPGFTPRGRGGFNASKARRRYNGPAT